MLARSNAAAQHMRRLEGLIGRCRPSIMNLICGSFMGALFCASWTASTAVLWRFAGLGILAFATLLVVVVAFRPVDAALSNPEKVARVEAARAESAQRTAAAKAIDEVIALSRAPFLDAATGCANEDLGKIVFPQMPTKDAKPYCWTIAGDRSLDSCAYGSKAPDGLRMAVIGDSHARHLMPGLRSVAEDEMGAIKSFFGNGCSLTVAPLESCATAGAGILCAQTQGDTYDVVVVSVSLRKAVNVEAVATAIRQGQSTGAKVVIMEDVPTTSPEAIACSTDSSFDVKTARCGKSIEGMKVDLMVELGRDLGVGVGVITPVLLR